ncbi:hypothetical protein GCM10023237_39910 [Streptomyces coeruleoprunus]
MLLELLDAAGFASEDEEDADDEDDADDDADEEDFDAGELLDDAPRLSLR